MSIVVTAATGQFGRLVIEDLLERGIPAAGIVATGRRTEQLADLAERGVVTRRLDYDDPTTFAPALEGAEQVLLVSGLDMGRRVEQHSGVAAAAADAGARSIAYTSAPHASTSSMRLVADHRGTEEAIAALGVPYTFLRNGWYFENYTAQVPAYLGLGAVVGAAGEGRISGASRADLALAAAVVLTSDGHGNAVYELGGDDAFTLAGLAETVGRLAGKPVEYRDVSVPELVSALESAGLPGPFAAMLADTDRAVRDEGALFIDTGDLSRLIGRPTSTLDQAVEKAL